MGVGVPDLREYDESAPLCAAVLCRALSHDVILGVMGVSSRTRQLAARDFVLLVRETAGAHMRVGTGAMRWIAGDFCKLLPSHRVHFSDNPSTCRIAQAAGIF